MGVGSTQNGSAGPSNAASTRPPVGVTWIWRPPVVSGATSAVV